MRAWLVLCGMATLQFFIALDMTVVNVALPSIGADFSVDDHALTWVVVGYTITGGGLLMLGGRAGRRARQAPHPPARHDALRRRVRAGRARAVLRPAGDSPAAAGRR
ncbi:hypothetical protein ACFSTC_38550 [Nonomuraea ferruginea]